MSAIADYVLEHTVRGECQCGSCIDSNPEAPEVHGVDMVFFKVAPQTETADADTFRRLTAEHRSDWGEGINPLDGAEHNYMNLGAWIGDQGLAMQYMALGSMLKVFNLFSPALLSIDGDLALQMAQVGYLTVRAKS